MLTLLAQTDADLPLVRGVALKLRQLFGVSCEVSVATAHQQEGELVLERHGTTRERKRGAFLFSAWFCASGPLVPRPFKFKASINSSIEDVTGDEEVLHISLATRLLPFFAPHQQQHAAPQKVALFSQGCGAAFARVLAEALSYERFEVDVRDEALPAQPLETNWIAPGTLGLKGASLKSASLGLGEHREKWGPVKVTLDPEANEAAHLAMLARKLAEKFSELETELGRRAWRNARAAARGL